MKYLIAGATGFVGEKLVNELIAQNNEVTVLSRSIEKAQNLFGEKVQVALWENIYQSFKLRPQTFDCVVNLMGENIAEKNWTNERKKQLYNSRVDGTKYLLNFLNEQKVEYKKIVQSSAIGIYQENGNVVAEESEFAQDFLGKLCQDWEKQVTSTTENYVILRTGMVLGKGGGAMSKILPLFKYGLGGNLGSGSQNMSWIHIHDLVSLIIKASQDKQIQGVYNAVSQYPVSNKEFTHILSDLMRKPAFFHAPKLALKLVLGEMSSVVLSDLKVKSNRLKEAKFVFKYPTIENALKEVVSK